MRAFFYLIVFSLINISAFAQADSGAYFKSFDGTKIYYEVKGTGEPVLLVHGFIVNGQSWKRTELYKDLIAEGYKVIILDQRGNGFSDKPHDSTAYDNDAEAKDIMSLMKHLKIKKYSAVGYSRGSIIVARLLALDKNIKKAVIGGMGAEFTNPEWPRRIMFYHALRGDSVPELKAMVENVKKQGLDQQALAYLQRSQPSTSKEVLGNVKQPVLIICGDKDSDNGSAKELADLFKHPTYKVTPGDHGGASRTAEFSGEVIKFLKQEN
jgi:pimeloyl-ACP methyl ester carboxylesterase